MSKRLIIILGTKAQLIKLAPVLLELKRQKVKFTLVFTGQHQATMSAMQDQLSLPKPHFTLYTGPDITKIWQVPGWFVITSINAWKYRQDIFGQSAIVLVHGDTFSTILGAILGKLLGHKVAHVEAGLRSFNIFHPFPEEITRIIVSRLCSIHFCAGKWACRNLDNFGGKIIDTKSNTLYDTLQLAIKLPRGQKLNIPTEPYGLCSLHRFETIFRPVVFRQAIKLVLMAARQRRILFILHPPTHHQLKKLGWLDWLSQHPNLEFRPRYPYLEFIELEKSAEFVITDGGSNQEECFYMGKPCLLLRHHTERQEGLNQNVVLSKFNEKVVSKFLADIDSFQRPPLSINSSPSRIIVKELKKQLA